jgi:hypothetical protein
VEMIKTTSAASLRVVEGSQCRNGKDFRLFGVNMHIVWNRKHRVLHVIVPKWFKNTDALDKRFACFIVGNMLHLVEIVKKIADILG